MQSTGGIPYYVPGSNGDEALRIVNGSNVNLSPATTDGLQFGTGQSFTFQFVLRTTSANGVLLGEMPGDPGYTFSLVNGAITLNLNDGRHSETLTGPTIDDGAWHNVVGVRNTANGTVSLYVDGSLVATAQDTTGNLENSDDVTLGSYADGSDQLTFDIDLVQATRGALTPSQFLTSSYVPPQTLPVPATPANNVLNLPGLGFYLPPYDDRHYFADMNESDPLLIQPTPGTAAQSAIDATGQYDVAGGATVYYETDPTVGSYWSSQGGTGWTVANSNGTQSPTQNFDFVQNTETFTISDVFNIPSVPTNGSLQLVGNNSDTSARPGFYLAVDGNGNLDFNITDGLGTGASLLDQDLATYSGTNNSLPQLSTGVWYQIVIVGNGPGTPLQYYLTPMTAAEVQQYQSSKSMAPIGAPTATGATQNLQIANVSDAATPGTPTVNFKDLAIFNQALTPPQVEQLFLDEANPLVVTPSGTTNTFTVSGSAVPVDPGLTILTGNTDLTGATVTISPGTLQSGDTLNFTSQNGITGSYSGGVLTLSGSATPAQYQAALQSVTFSTSGSTGARSLAIVANDGTLDSDSAAESLNVAVAIITASGATNTFVIGGAAVAVDSGVTVMSYQTDLTAASVTIGNFQVGDTLNFTNQNGITGSYSAGLLTLTGSATPAQYQAALQSVTFSTTSLDTDARSLSIAATDGSLDSDLAAEDVNVVLPQPVVTPSANTGQTFTVGSSAVAVDSGVAVSSQDIDITGASIQIANYQSGDTLNFTYQNGISGSYSAGLLTLTGSATPAQYTTALQSVTFSTSSINTSARSLSIVAIDGSLNSNPAAESVNVALPPPIVTPSEETGQTFTLGALAVAVDSGVTVSSFDAGITGASVQIANYQSGDTLNFTNQNGITGTYSAGVLSLTGFATPAQYTTALQSVTFSTTSFDTETRSLSIVAVDGLLDSNAAAETVNVAVSNYQVLYSFTGVGTDGVNPFSGLTLVGNTLFGTTASGGSDGDGTVFSVNADGSDYQVLYSFTGTGNDGANPYASLTLAGNTLYGTTWHGGANGDGTIFSINTDGSGYQVLYSFTDTGNDGANPCASLTLVGNTLYGTTRDGGADGDGTVFSVNTDGSAYQVLYSFTGTGNDGANPNAGLTLVGSALFGTTVSGGSDGDGTVFSINTDGSNYQELYSFTGTGNDGANPYAGLTLVGSALFGTTWDGGTDGDGTVFSINTDGSGYQVLYSFTDTGNDGAEPYAGLTVVGSTLFGTTVDGGANADGTAFSINTDGNAYQILYSFTGTGNDGAGPYAGLTLVGSALFGTTLSGGTDGNGTAFVVSGATPTVIVTPSAIAADYGTGSAGVDVDPGIMVSSSDPDLSGATVTISPDTLQPGDILSFTSPFDSGISGTYSGGVLTLSGSATPAQYEAALQSVTFSSTSGSTATRSISIVAIDNNLQSSAEAETIDVSVGPPVVTASGNTGQSYSLGGSAVAVDSAVAVSSFDADLTGASITITDYQPGDSLNYIPTAGITIASNAGGVLTLTGTATLAQYQAALQSVTFSTTGPTGVRSISIVAIDGLLDSIPAVESVNVAIGDYQYLYSFSDTGNDGANSYAGLAVAGSTLYGTTWSGGANGSGTIFSVNTDGSDYQVLYSFTDTGTDGAYPYAGLTLVGNTLYGTTVSGGSDGDGTIFSINTDGSDYQIVYSFTDSGADGANPNAGLTLVGNTLYGTTTYGGTAGYGTVFSINTDGSGYQDLYSFTATGTDGADPYGNLTLVGSTLFGTTAYGGIDDDGTVFSIYPDGSDYQVLYSFTNTGNDGADPYADLTLDGSTLFGTTYGGGPDGNGTIFSINTDGSDYQVLYAFTDSDNDGVNPNGLTLVGNTLFGTTAYGGADGNGSVFSINPDGSGYQVLNSFTGTGSVGASPNDTLTLVGDTLFGTTAYGGTDGYGTVFSVSGATPTVTATPSGNPANYTMGAAAVYVDPGVTVSSSDPDLSGATVTINNPQSGDVLSFTSPVGSGIGGTYSGGVLTLSGNATPAQYQAILQSVAFSSAGGSSATRSISIVAIDNNLYSSAASESVNVSIAAPVVTVNQARINDTAGQTVLVDSALTVSSFDADVTGATMTIGTGYQPGSDTLNFTNQNGITGNYAAGVLTLTGNATPAQYQAALQSVTFSSTSTSTTTRNISIVVDDSSTSPTTSNTATTQIVVSSPVTVSAVYISGSAWAPSFDSYLASHNLGSATYGYALQSGANQLKTLPWTNLNTITVTFSGPVSGVALGSLKLAGGSGGLTPTVTGFRSDGGNTYSWTLSGPLTNNKYAFGIASTNSSFGPAVVDSHGAGISGAFSTGQAFPSGNGLAGSTFDFFFDVLPGDTNRDGQDNATDINNIRPLASGTRTTSASYNPYYDLAGAGTINAVELNAARYFSGRLESAESNSAFRLTTSWDDRLHGLGIRCTGDRQLDFADRGRFVDKRLAGRDDEQRRFGRHNVVQHLERIERHGTNRVDRQPRSWSAQFGSQRQVRRHRRGGRRLRFGRSLGLTRPATPPRPPLRDARDPQSAA